MTLLRWIFIFIVTASFGFAAEEKASEKAGDKGRTVPNVNSLSVSWWDFFQSDPEMMDEKIALFRAEIEQLGKSLSPETKRSAEEALKKIEINLKSYSQNLATPLPSPSIPSPIAKKYTIGEIIRLYRSNNQKISELHSLQIEREDKQKQLARNEELLTIAKKSYADSENRSEERFVQGLDVVALRTRIELLKQTLEFMKLSIKSKEGTIEQGNEELKLATLRLTSDGEELQLFKKELRESLAKLKTADESLKERQAEEATALAESVSREDDKEYLKAVQLTDSAEINRSILKNQAIFAEIKVKLSELFTSPSSIQADKVQSEIADWQRQDELAQQKIAEWGSQAERLVQRIGQILAEEGLSKKNDLTPLSKVNRGLLEIAQQNLVLIRKLENEIDDTKFLLELYESRLSEKIGGTEYLWRYLLELLSSSYEKGLFWFSRDLFSVGENEINLSKIVQFFTIIILTFWLSRLILATLTRFAQQRKGIKKSLVYRVSRLFYYLLLALGVMIGLSVIGFDFSNFLLVAGALGVGIGFGLQSIFNNFISGIIILFESHLKVGDYVELASGLRGEIREINVRTTVITDNDGVDVLVPNSEIISNQVSNWTLQVPYRRFHIPFTVAYGTDKDKLAAIIIEAAKEVPHTLTQLGVPEPMVRMTKLGDYGLEFELVVWVSEKYTKRKGRTRSDYLWVIETALGKHGISIPYPLIEVRHLNNGGES